MEYTIKNIRNIRKGLDLSQEEFAEKLDVSVNSIRNWEHGDNVPPMDKIQKICGILGCDIDHLFGIIPQKTYLLTDFADKTGLSSDAITVLCNMSPNRIENLSFLLTNERFQEILGRLSTYGVLGKIEFKAAHNGDLKTAHDSLDDQMLEMYKMEYLFRHLVDDYQTYRLKKWEDENNDD